MKNLSAFLFFLTLSATIVYPSAGVQAQTVIWEENFNDEPNGATTGDDDNIPTGADWTTSYSGSGSFEVQGDEFLVENSGNEGSWTSEIIIISSAVYAQINIKVSGLVNNGNELLYQSNEDYIKCFYKIDNGPEVLFYEHVSSGALDQPSNTLLSQMLDGDSLQIIIKSSTDQTSSFLGLTNDYYSIDNIQIIESNSLYRTLYAIDNGEWHEQQWVWNGDGFSQQSIWSYDDYSGTQSNCFCIPDASTNVIIGEGYNVEIANDGAAWDVTVQDNGILEFKRNGTILDIGNDLIISGSGHIRLKQGEINLAGNWNNSSTHTNSFDEGNGKATFEGGIQHIINSSGNETFNELEVNNSSLVLNTKVTIDNSMTFTNGIVSSTAVNLLVFEDNADSSPPVAGSFVSGPVSKIGNDDFIFPIGKGSVLGPLAIVDPDLYNATPASQFTAEYFVAPAPSSNNLPASGLSHVSAIEYWDLARVSSDNAQAVVELMTLDKDRSEIYEGTLEDVVVAHYNETTLQWEALATVHGAISGNLFTVKTAGPVASFSPFAFGSSGGISPLPVTLVTFNGENTPRGNRLTWQTTSETENDFFAVERSKDGKLWKTLGKVKGSGNSSHTQVYTYLDASPFYGPAFYRLKQVDFDGEFEYSKIISVHNSTMAEPGIALLYPNPTKGEVILHYTSSGKGELSVLITNQQGEEQIRQQYQAGERFAEIKLDLSGLSPGLYFLILQQNHTRTVEKLIKE